MHLKGVLQKDAKKNPDFDISLECCLDEIWEQYAFDLNLVQAWAQASCKF